MLLLVGQAALAAVPDFSGVWERYPALHVPGSSRDVLFGADPVPGGEPPQLREPYASAYQARQEKEHAAMEAGKPLADTSSQCLPNGMPTMMTGILPIQIVQTRREMLVIAEELAQLRHIHFHEKLPSLDDIVPGYNGYSVGRFEGRTLVIETLGIREDVQFLGMPHSENMKLVERFKLIAPNMLEVRIEIHDPEVLLHPYPFTFTYKNNPHYRLAEYVCDNNQYRVKDDGTVHFDTQLAAKKPDLSGVWEAYHVSHEPSKAGQDVFVDEPALIGGRPKLREPYASAYEALQKKKQAAEEAGQPIIDSRTQCLPEGMPEMMMAILPIEILQTDREMVVLTELFAQTRRIYLNRKMPPLDDIVPGYFGYSVGHWQGTTLVVETQGIREDVRFLDMPHSSQMKITEQFKLVDTNVLEVHIVIDDPEVLAEPYRFAYKYKGNPDYQIGEYVCDNNRYRTNQDGDVKLDLEGT